MSSGKKTPQSNMQSTSLSGAGASAGGPQPYGRGKGNKTPQANANNDVAGSGVGGGYNYAPPATANASPVIQGGNQPLVVAPYVAPPVIAPPAPPPKPTFDIHDPSTYRYHRNYNEQRNRYGYFDPRNPTRTESDK